MGGGGKGGGGGGGSSEVRFAPYVEAVHSNFLADIDAARHTAIEAGAPFATYTDVPVNDAFFGVGYIISSFPSLYDMFGKFMAGLDVEVLWAQELQDTVNNSGVDALIAAESALLDADIESNVLPKFQTGMRDMNAVMSSSYIVGKSLIYDARVKAVAKFSGEVKYRLIPVAQDRWAKHLDWNAGVVMKYAELMKLYYSVWHDMTGMNYEMKTKTALWPFTVMEYERAALGALQGANNTKTDVAGGSTGQKLIGGALSGAASGAMIGSVVPGVGTVTGAAVGGLVGGIAGLLG